MSKVNYGIQDVYVAKITETDGAITYGTPFAVKGAVSMSVEPEGGDATPYYADNMVYFMAPATNNGYSGTLEIAITPEAFLTQILGQTKYENGMVVEKTDDASARFALMFQAQGDTENRRFCFYDCTAKRPSRTNETKGESIEIANDSLEITMNGRTTDNIVKAYAEQGSTAYDSWFNAVPEPPTTPSI